MKKLLALVIIGFVAYSCISLPPSDRNSLELVGTVARVYESGTNDIVFQIGGKDPVFYINRGLEAGLDIQELEKKLLGREVSLTYAKSLFTPKVRHLYHIQFGEEIIFSEYPDFIPVSLRK